MAIGLLACLLPGIARAAGEPALTSGVSEISLRLNDEKELTVSLASAENYKAVQLDITVPDGVTIPEGGVTLGAGCVSDHSLSMSKLTSAENTYRLIVQSPTNSAFVKGEGMFVVKLKSDETNHGGDVVFKNALVIDREGYAETAVAEELRVTIPAMAQISSIAIEGGTSVNMAETLQLSAAINPDNAAWLDMTWSTSDPAVATVTPEGLVSGVSKGTATISVSARSYGQTFTATAELTVTNYVREVTLAVTDIMLERDKTYQFEATVTPADADEREIKWSVSDSSIATIDSNGLLTALKPGTVTVTALSEKLQRWTTANVIVKDYLYGDADDNGAITLADVNTVIAYILEKNPEPFSFEKADISLDERISVADVTMITDLLLQAPAGVAEQFPQSDAEVTATVMRDESGCWLTLGLNSLQSVNAFQADLKLPEGLTVKDVKASDTGTCDLKYRKVDDTTLRVIVYSSSLEEYRNVEPLRIELNVPEVYDGSGSLQVMDVYGSNLGDGDFAVKNAELPLSNLSSVSSLATDESDAEYFTVNGLSVKAPEAHGVYLQRKADGTVKKIIR